MGFETGFNLYMLYDGLTGGFAINGECAVKPAESESELEAGREIDIEGSVELGTPADFAVRKTLRKKEVFREKDKKLYSYLCYYKNQVVGKCELFIKDEFAKIEDLDVLQKYRQKGFGTSMLKHMISEAGRRGCKHIYLITGKDDTPREMYGKLGFKIIGEELELFWSQSNEI